MRALSQAAGLASSGPVDDEGPDRAAGGVHHPVSNLQHRAVIQKEVSQSV